MPRREGTRIKIGDAIKEPATDDLGGPTMDLPFPALKQYSSRAVMPLTTLNAADARSPLPTTTHATDNATTQKYQ